MLFYPILQIRSTWKYIAYIFFFNKSNIINIPQKPPTSLTGNNR
jgi:hypothetical protein